MPVQDAARRVIVATAGPLQIKQQLAHPTNYSPHRRLTTRAIVLHCTDGCEGTNAAEDCAHMFAGKLANQRSCHYAVDADSIVRSVPDLQVAWHCAHAGNAIGVGVEICGRASQTRAQWLDETSYRTLCLAARLVADLCTAFALPPRFVDAAGLRVGEPGITTHAEVSKAWQQTHHTDPGPGFPLVDFVSAVSAAMLS